ncbi:hypothetical protein OH77DRAFT_1436824 [Trametes cingulata]|nr:hypothetical protein OH77DRAFT_1436824 [Trametes cingulata]
MSSQSLEEPSAPSPDHSSESTNVENTEGCAADSLKRRKSLETIPSKDLRGPDAPSPRSVVALRRSILAPHIIVLYAGHQSAWGRQGVAFKGYRRFAKLIFDAYILHPSRSPPREFRPFRKTDYSQFWKIYDYLKDDFLARARMIPRFAVASSTLDEAAEESLTLQSVGWHEMMQNIVSIRIEYTIPEEYPGKAWIQQFLHARGAKRLQ